MSAPRRVALVGSTASGKSRVAMDVARQVGDVHLVSVDSMQVYRGMDIGTAKPSAADRAAVPHHCLDLVDPTDEFTLGAYRAAYGVALDDIIAVAGSAVLVGGTGLYHRLVVDDLELPGEWPDVRAEIEAEPDTRVLHDRLRRVDPSAAAKMEPDNRRRVVRALEVTLGSGRPFSTHGPGLEAYPESPVVQIGIQRSREDIAARIELRVGEMISAGLIEEVRALQVDGFSRTAAQALGYKEVLQYLDGEIGKDAAIDLIITRTRQFAVRQERWFRRDPRIRWLEAGDDPAYIVSACADALRTVQ